MSSLLKRAGWAVLLALAGGAAAARGEAVVVHAEGVGAGWDRYAEYLHRFAENVETGWSEAAPLRKSVPPRDAVAALRVVLDRDGRVEKVLGFGATANVPPSARQLCQQAIQAYGSYPPWSEIMAKDLGPRRQITVEFDFP